MLNIRILLTSIVLLGMPLAAPAQDFTLHWWTIDGGGGHVVYRRRL